MALYNSERTLQKAQLYGKDGIYRSPRPSLSIPNDPNFSVIPCLFRNFPSIAHLPALIDAETAETLTFSDLKTQVFGLSNALLNLNISKNDVVLILLPNSILYPVAFFSALAIGAIATTANPQYSVAEVTKQVQDSNPKLIFTNHNLYDKVKGFDLPCIMLNTPETNCWRASSKSRLYYCSDLIELYSDKLSDAKLPPIMQTDAAAIMYTSGTSGTSKGAVLTHRNLIASGPDDYIGDTVVVMARYDIDKMLMAVEKYKVTHLYIVPPVAVELAKKQELIKKYNVSSLVKIVSAAAPLGKHIEVKISKIFPQAVLYQAYGMTEFGGIFSIGNACPSSSSEGSTGTLAPEVEAQIINLDTMKPLPPCQIGEIWSRGPSVMKGYWKNDKATMEIIDDEGWLHTGDLGYFDNDGQLYIVDRVKELIKYKGFQVAPPELEKLLLTHPEVADAAVIGIPDAEAGEVPIAFVVRTSLSSITSEEIKEFIAKQVAHFKRLRGVIFTDVIPKSSFGKILKKELRQKYMSRL